jgi:hypothetical protein
VRHLVPVTGCFGLRFLDNRSERVVLWEVLVYRFKNSYLLLSRRDRFGLRQNMFQSIMQLVVQLF